eukprot:3096965-Prymnesium_polylepis.1
MKPDRSAADREVARCDGGNRPDAANGGDSSVTPCAPLSTQSHAVACSLHSATRCHVPTAAIQTRSASLRCDRPACVPQKPRKMKTMAFLRC